jgi:hypothetical protein
MTNFIVSKTSVWSDEERPCKEAVSGTRKGRTVWKVKIESLKDLINFSKKHGQLVISTGGTPEIEIYDGYRE